MAQSKLGQGVALPGKTKTTKVNRELNILLLGQTGVGKSTFINAFANYIRFASMDEAKIAPNCVIKASFSMHDEQKRERKFSVGEDDNELCETGQSSTQKCKTYLFRGEGINIRLIDTPGIGDTRGIEYDTLNLQNILQHIAPFKELQGICILLTPNNSRIDILFEFCIKELLYNLHRSACDNVVFCFTNTRGTMYKPGDTLTSLRQLLLDMKLKIPLNADTIYCVENETIKYLYSCSELQHTDFEWRACCESYEQSAFELKKMLQHFLKLHAHNVEDTVSLNRTRYMIETVGEPMAHISASLQASIFRSRQQKKELSSRLESFGALQEKLTFRRTMTIAVPVNPSRKGCAKCATFTAEGLIVFPKCSKKRKSFLRSTTCITCGCLWSEHKDITFEYKQIEMEVFNRSVKVQMDTENNQITKISRCIEDLKCLETEYSAEQDKLIHVLALGACFLKNNSIVPYNDAMDRYLEFLINNEKKKSDGDVGRLEHIRQKYREQTVRLERAINDDKSRIPTDEEMKNIKARIDELYKLQHTGPMLRDIMTVATAAELEATRSREVIV